MDTGSSGIDGLSYCAGRPCSGRWAAADIGHLRFGGDVPFAFTKVDAATMDEWYPTNAVHLGRRMDLWTHSPALEEYAVAQHMAHIAGHFQPVLTPA